MLLSYGEFDGSSLFSAFIEGSLPTFILDSILMENQTCAIAAKIRENLKASFICAVKSVAQFWISSIVSSHAGNDILNSIRPLSEGIRKPFGKIQRAKNRTTCICKT